MTTADIRRALIPAQRPAPPAAPAPARSRPAEVVTLVLLAFDLAAAAPPLIALPHLRLPLSVLVLIALAVLRHAGLFRPRLTLSVLDDMPALAAGALIGFAVGAGLLGVLGRAALLPEFGRATAVLGAGLLLARTAAYTVVRRLRRVAALRHATIMVGAGGIGPQVAAALRNHREYGLDPVGFLDDGRAGSVAGLPVLGRVSDLPALLAVHRVDTIVVGSPEVAEREVVDVVRRCDRSHVEVLTVPRLHQVHSGSSAIESVRGVPLVRLRRPAYRSSSWRLKRVVDVGATLAGGLLLAPLLALVAAAVVVDTGRPVLFRQERVGLDGRRFQLLKFRTLRPATEAESATNWSIAADNRVSRVGRLLRRTSLDELPQLWNILRGDMTLVGPRPERPFFVERFSAEHEEYPWRHRVPCGLTGWAQVNGLRGDTSIHERARLDNYYIENWSLWLDVKILLLTVAQVLRGAGR